MKPNHFGSQLKTGIFMVCREWTGGRLHSIRLADFIWNHGRYFLSPQVLGILWSRLSHTLQTFMTFKSYMFLKMWCNGCNNFHLMRKLRDTLKKIAICLVSKRKVFQLESRNLSNFFHDFPSNRRVFEFLHAELFYRFSWKINMGVNSIYFA